MEQRGPVFTSLPAESPCPINESPACGDEELDEETVNYLAALYTALGPLLPEVINLQNNQDPPAHLMIGMKSRLQQMGSTVSDAKKLLLQYNRYLKKRLLKAAEEQKARLEHQGEDTCKPDLPPPESKMVDPLEKIQRQSSFQLASLGKDNSPLQEQAGEQTESVTSPPGTPKSTRRRDILSPRNNPSQSLS